MKRTEITLTSGQLSMNLNGGGMSVTVDALETLKKIGVQYGLYSHREDDSGYRVAFEDKPVPALVIQENISYHGSPCWDTVGTLTTDPERISQYRAFKSLVSSIQKMEREAEQKPLAPPQNEPSGDTSKKKD